MGHYESAGGTLFSGAQNGLGGGFLPVRRRRRGARGAAPEGGRARARGSARERAPVREPPAEGREEQTAGTVHGEDRGKIRCNSA